MEQKVHIPVFAFFLPRTNRDKKMKTNTIDNATCLNELIP